MSGTSSYFILNQDIEERVPLVAHIFNKFEPLLPTESNNSIYEVESNIFFLSSRKALINLSVNNMYCEILKYGIQLIEAQNKKDSYLILRQRSIESLSSILVILRLLADLAKFHWDSREPKYQRKNSIDSTSSTNSNNSLNDIGIASVGIDYHTLQPDKLESELATSAIILISKLKSTKNLVYEIALLNGKVAVTNESDLTFKSTIDQIDLNCEALLRFLAASNPLEFLNFSVHKLNILKHNINNENEFAPYLELLSAIYLNEAYILEYLKHLRNILTTIRKQIYRQLLLIFFMKGVKIWINSRPQEYLNCTKVDSNVSMEADLLFDEVFTFLDSGPTTVTRLTSSGTTNNNKQFKSSYRFLALLLTLYPKAIETYLFNGARASKSNTLKKLTNFNTNKKSKLLSNVTKVLDMNNKDSNQENNTVLECLDFAVCVANIAASIYPYDHQNILVQYSLLHSDSITKALVPISSTNQKSPLLQNASVSESQVLGELRLEYYSSLCVLNSRNFIPNLLRILEDESASLEALKLTTSILKMFSSTLHSRESSENLIRQVFPLLKKVMTRIGSLVESSSYAPSLYEGDDSTVETSSLGKTNSGTSAEFYSQYSFKAADKMSTDLSSSSAASIRQNATTSTPKTEKFKDTTKSLFRSHHLSSSHQHGSHGSSSSNSTTIGGGNSLSSHSSHQSIALEDRSVNESKDLVIQLATKNSVLSRDILSNSFAIFKKYPHLYFLSSSISDTNEAKYRELYEDSYSMLEPFIISLKDSDPKLVLSCTQYLLSFISANVIPDDFDHVLCAFAGCFHVVNALAKSLIDTSPSDPKRRDLLELFVKFIEYRVSLNTTLEHYEYYQFVKVLEKDFYTPIIAPVEQGLLICLCTPSFDTYGLIKRGFKGIDDELSFNDISQNHEINECDFNRDFYRIVANDTSLTTGVVALQKNIRRYFLKIENPSIAVINVWLKVYDRWNDLANSDYSEMSSAELSEFRNFAGFLAAVSGIFVKSDSANLTDEIRHDLSEKIDEFISRELGLLREDNLVTRENAKEILASETNPLTYGRIVRLLVPMVKNFERDIEHLSPKDFIVIEHIVVLLKAMLNNGSPSTIFAVSVDILSCTSIVAKIIDSVEDVNVTILKLRIRISRLFYDIENNNDALVIKSAYKLRNTYLRHVYNWFDNAVAYDCNCNDSSHQHHQHSQHPQHSNGGRDLDYIYIDIAIESVKALSLLLDSLLLEAPQVMNERELKFSKASLFSIYFNTFLKALERYSNLESFPISVKHKVSTVSDHIIACLTNLLKSNVDVGLAYALPIGYHSNLAIRTAFLKVFVSIVESYSSTRTSTSGERIKRLMDSTFQIVFTKPRVMTSIARACPTNDAAALASCSLSLADSVNQSAPLVSYLVQEEIMSGNNYTDILRRNSFASKSLSAFGRAKGNEYLIATLRPILTEIRDSELDLEVEKVHENDPVCHQNLSNFMHYLKKLVNVIIRSINDFPLEFRAVCKTISESVQNKFPKYRIIAVGSFIFLRFFCPAIVSPESERIVDIPNRQTQRKFLLLAKVLQNMANGSLGSLRWPLLKSKSQELNDLNDNLFEFLDQCTIIDDSVTFEIKKFDEVNEQDFGFFHTFMYENWQTVRSETLRNVHNDEDIKTSLVLATDVSEILSILGQPTIRFGYEIPASINPENNSELFEFMSRYSLKDLADIQDSSFIYQGISSDGSPLLVFSYSDFLKLKETNQEIALYRIFQVASKMWDQKFSFVVDCTGNDGSQVFPYRLLVLLGNLAPEEMRNNCQGVHYYNISSGLFPNFFRNSKDSNNYFNQGGFQYYFPSARSDYKQITNLGLPEETIRSYHDVRAKFNDVSLYQPEQHRFVPVIVKIGSEYLQISHNTPQRLKVKSELKEIYLNDVFKLQKISNVAVSETTGVPNEITISFENGKQIILSSPKSLDIMRLLYFTKNRVTDMPTETLFKKNIEKSVEDLLGQLFNIIFLGLTSASAEVRSISYNLLAASQKKFSLNLGRELAQAPEVYFPRDNNTFVVAMSEKLAQSFPRVTAEVIGAFFKVYREQATPRQRFNAILYIAPWIPNIYEHVFIADEENGADYVAEIIRSFLSVSSIDPVFLSSFNDQIWSKLCLEDRISPILINEIVLTAIDREAEGTDWKSIIALLTSTPTVELCGHVIRRLRDIPNIPFPDGKGNYSVDSHSSWIEITVLVQICVSLFFDSLMFAEMFLPEIFYVVTVLVDVGPLDLRTASHQLLLNVLQSFLTKSTLTEDAKSKIRSIIESFTSHRSRILFGLNRDNADNFPTEIAKISTRVTTMESLVASLLEVMELASTDNMNLLWIARWNRYVVDAIARKDSVLRGRALLLLGVLSKGGVNDTMVVKILEMVAEVSTEDIADPKYRYLAFCTTFSLSRITEGLLPGSLLYSKMFWLALIITHSNHIALYQGGNEFITKTLFSMHIKSKFINNDVLTTLLDDKVIFGTIFKQVEELDELVATRENFDQVLLHYSLKGLQLPHSRASAIESLKTFFNIRYTNEMARKELDPKYNIEGGLFAYLLFLYILLKPSELKDVMNNADMGDYELIELGEQAFVPKVIFERLLLDNVCSNLSLLQACVHFNEGDPNEKSRIRLLLLLKHVAQKNPRILMKIYFKIKPTLTKIISSSSVSVSLITTVFDVASIANVQPDFTDDAKHEEQAEQLLVENKVRGILKYKFLKMDNSMTAEQIRNTSHSRGAAIKTIIDRICATRVETE